MVRRKKKIGNKEDTTMKKMMTNIKTLAALLIASATLAACSSDDNTIDQQPAQPAGQQVYTMTVNASKGGDAATTRALTLDGKTLNATWATTENIYVKKGETWATGSLQPQADGTTATLKGTLSGITIAASDVLTLQFPRSGELDYTGQVGTLEDIAAKYDYATATVTVASVSATGNINPTAATTSFTNQQAIVKFTLKDKDTDAAINATELIVSDGTNSYTVTPAPATNEIYAAIPGIASQTVTLTATVGSDTYTYEKSNVTFVNGKYYSITVKMTKQVTTASTLSQLKTAINSGTDCSSYVGWQVNSNGDIAESNVSGTKIGYVAYVSTSAVDENFSSSRILVISASDVATSTKWSNSVYQATETGITDIKSTSKLNGYANTQALYNKRKSDLAAAKAAWEYQSKNGNAVVTGSSGWFLPCYKQWVSMRDAQSGSSNQAKRNAMNSVFGLSGDYWSSTEYNNGQACHLDMNGTVYNYSKNLTFNVRACFAY